MGTYYRQQPGVSWYAIGDLNQHDDDNDTILMTGLFRSKEAYDAMPTAKDVEAVNAARPTYFAMLDGEPQNYVSVLVAGDFWVDDFHLY